MKPFSTIPHRLVTSCLVLGLSVLVQIGARPALADDSGKIVFSSDRDADNFNVYIMDADGGNVRQLTNDSGNEINPCLSPDGRKIIWVTQPNGGPTTIREMNVDGTNERQLVSSADIILDFSSFLTSPVYSPDGSKIAFCLDRNVSENDIWILDLKDSSLRRVTRDIDDESTPSWSPDASQLIYCSSRLEWEGTQASFNPRLFKINANGTGKQSFGGEQDNWTPAWSLSNRIAFESGKQIYAIAANGSGQQRLTSVGENVGPAWNPGGDKLAFTSTRDGQREIYTMNADGSAQTRVTSNPAFDTGCWWGRSAMPAGPQTLSIGNASVVESESGTTQLQFKVSLSTSATVPVSVNYATRDGTATAGADYQKTSGTVFFKVGERDKFIDVTVFSDLIEEPSETMLVNLTNPLGVTFLNGAAVGTITDDGKVGVTCSSVAVTEGNDAFKDVPLTVSLSGPSSREVSVTYATEQGTAYPNADYVPATGTLKFAPGETQKQILITIKGEDYFYEEDEVFRVVLSNLVNAKPVPEPIQDQILNPTNGHWYQLVKKLSPWNAAKTDAESRKYYGVSGHLATVGSVEEQNFLTERFGLENYYLGGYKSQATPPPAIPAPVPWLWVTGEAFEYENWYSEYYYGYEMADVFYSREATRYAAAGKWWPSLSSVPRNYLVEYDTTASSPRDLLSGEVRILNDERQSFPPPFVIILEPVILYHDELPKPYIKDLPRINGLIERYGDGSSGDINRVDVSLFRKDIGKYWDGSAWSSVTRIPLSSTVSFDGTWHIFHVTASLPSPSMADDLRKLTDGDYELLVYGYNQYGRATGDLSYFTVDASLPTVKLTSPPNGAFLR